MSSAVSSSAFVNRPGFRIFSVIMHLLQCVVPDRPFHPVRIGREPGGPDFPQRLQFVAGYVFVFAFGEAVQEHRRCPSR